MSSSLPCGGHQPFACGHLQFRGGSLENPCDRGGLCLPVARFLFEARASARGKPVVLRAPVVLGGAPFARDQPVPLEPPQGGKQRSRVHLEDASADLLEAHPDPVSVHRLQRERLQDQHVQGPLHQVTRFSSSRQTRWSIRLLIQFVKRRAESRTPKHMPRWSARRNRILYNVKAVR